MQNQPYNLWPGRDDAQAIDAMLDDHHSLYEYHWRECLAFVNGLVKVQASNFSKDEKEDIAQNASLKIIRSLRKFKRESKLTTWIIIIVRNCIFDAGREQQAYLKREIAPQYNTDDEEEEEDYMSRIRSPKTTEEECVLREDMRETNEKLQKYLSKRINKERTLHIFEKYLEGLNQEEIARELDMPTPNVGYAIRSIQKYLSKQE